MPGMGVVDELRDEAEKHVNGLFERLKDFLMEVKDGDKQKQ